MTRVFVPGDASAVAVGADAVARILSALSTERELGLDIIRTGSRGMAWLEPLVEIETPRGRIGFGPIEAGHVRSMLDVVFRQTADGARLLHPKALGLVDAHPWLARQTRLTFARCGLVDPGSLADFCTHGGLRGLYRAVEMGPAAVLDEVTRSGLRGRGGAGFATGRAWQSVAAAGADRRSVVCQADEGDSGTFADRMMLEGDPFALIEGMMIAGFAVGAAQGYVYSRSDYALANARFAAALATARAAKLLGPKALGRGFGFDIELRVGTGAAVRGAQMALPEGREGKPDMVRALPDHEGRLGPPTVIDSLVTLATLPAILREGAARYADIGFGRSRGTMPIQLAGNVRRGGLFEAGFGLTLGEIVEDIGGGTASGRPVRAVQCGGPLGAYFPPALFDTPYDHEAFAAQGGLLGHGGIVVFDDSVDLARQARSALQVCASERGPQGRSCRIAATRGVETLDRIIAGERRAENIARLEDLCQTMMRGGLTPYPLLSALKYFRDDFGPLPVRVAAE